MTAFPLFKKNSFQWLFLSVINSNNCAQNEGILNKAQGSH